MAIHESQSKTDCAITKSKQSSRHRLSEWDTTNPTWGSVCTLVRHQLPLRITNKLDVRGVRSLTPKEFCCPQMPMSAFGTTSQPLQFLKHLPPTKFWQLLLISREPCSRLNLKPVFDGGDLKPCSKSWRLKVSLKKLVRHGRRQANHMFMTPKSGKV